MDPKTRDILADIFVVKRLEAMIEIFTLVLQMACSFKGTGICPVFDDNHLCEPLKKYLSNYAWRLTLGLESRLVAYIQCLMLQNEINQCSNENPVDISEMCNQHLTTVDTGLNGQALTMCESICQHLDAAWRKLSKVNHLEQQVARQTEGLRRSQLLLSAHMWMYEEAIANQAGLAIPTPISRSAILIDLTNAAQSLVTKKLTIQKWSEELVVLTTAITQRLKWAVGANPGLKELTDNFNEAIARKTAMNNQICSIAAIALTNCTSVLQYESMRVSTVEALEEDQQFLDLVSRWEKSCMMAQSCSTVVTNIEEALVELLDPEGPICSSWLNNVASLIDDMTEQSNIEVNAIEKVIIVSQDDVHSCAYRLGNLMAIRHRIAADIRTLLKSTMMHGIVKEYFQKYKPILEMMSDLHTNTLSKDFTESMVEEALQHIEQAINSIGPMYDDLFELEGYLRSSDDIEEKGVPAIAQLQQQDASRSNSPSTGRPKVQKGNKNNSVWFR